jgi:predicted DNA-binding WGR domain protein
MNYELDWHSPREKSAISRLDVISCEDVATLEGWFEDMTDAYEVVLSQTESFVDWARVGKPDQDQLEWFHRACKAKSALTIGLGKIKKRLREKGVVQSGDPIGMEINSLRAQLSEVKMRCAVLQRQLDSGEEAA